MAVYTGEIARNYGDGCVSGEIIVRELRTRSQLVVPGAD